MNFLKTKSFDTLSQNSFKKTYILYTLKEKHQCYKLIHAPGELDNKMRKLRSRAVPANVVMIT